MHQIAKGNTVAARILVTIDFTSKLTRIIITCNEITLEITGKAKNPLIWITPPPALCDTSELCQL
jgi:hypothetical protein